ncbi:hypothetical protein EC973_001822 [Apophysomyces ossiformis]|uniref:Uncharacterized protein n=1 Tax=Apophysomyces ossiformis TaxID=679940 RepID=A0A8H7BJ15_9FUNG|nr:hypothetical protein EC973_001822 [Apophysomyces ossiformis]
MPLIAVGISNPQDLQRAITSGIPIIHIQKTCLALKGAQRRHVRDTQAWNTTQLLSLAILWGSGGAYLTKRPFPQHASPVRRICLGAAAISLVLYTLRLMRVLRRDYDIIEEQDESFLLRNDVAESRLRHVIRIWLPFGIGGTVIGCLVRTFC